MGVMETNGRQALRQNNYCSDPDETGHGERHRKREIKWNSLEWKKIYQRSSDKVNYKISASGNYSDARYRQCSALSRNRKTVQLFTEYFILVFTKD